MFAKGDYMEKQLMGKWFEEMTVYQIWPRSFMDKNGDGIGDLYGVLDKLDYIKDLGVDCIWFSPLFTSPQEDYGYDIADYRNIAPEYGTLELFKTVLDECHKRDMRVLMDLVVNHTSSEHEWFKKSCRREPGYEDFYIWRKGKGKDGKKLPNNWMSTFPGPAWEWCEERGEYYLHLYAVGQPDLNHDNPAVREAVKDVMRFWLEMGVDGFREDVITQISKVEGLPDGMPLPASRGIEHYNNGPNIYKYLAEYRKVANEYGAVQIGEAPMLKPDVALNYVKKGANQSLDMMISFEHMEASCFMIDWLYHKFNLRKLKKIYDKWQHTMFENDGWTANYLENHDHPRVISRYGSEKYHKESGKALATMYTFLSGSHFVYQGQEIGMTNCYFESWDEFHDVSTHCVRGLMTKFFGEKHTFKTAQKAARDHARTPVQWSSEKGAGFSTAKSWCKTNPNFVDINVEDNLSDSDSILNHYKKIIKLRKEYRQCAIFGKFNIHLKGDKNLFVYDKLADNGDKMTVVLNLSEKEVSTKRVKGLIDADMQTLIASHNRNMADTLKPYEHFVFFKSAK